MLAALRKHGRHTHAWVYREKVLPYGGVITGYMCRCGARDYTDLIKPA